MRKYFGTDGIRRIANTELTPDLVFRVAKSGAYVFSKHVNNKPTILIGRDTRLSGTLIESAMTSGFLSYGANVKLLGVMPTPVVAYLTKKLNADASVVISASHNTFEFNGVKYFSNKGMKIPDEIEEEIEEVLDSERLSELVAVGENIGVSEEASYYINDYIEYITNIFKDDFKDIPDDFMVAIDTANGATYKLADEIYTRLGIKHVIINNNPNGININENAGSTHIEVISKFVKDHKFSLGIAYDGDGDRCLMTDENGKEIDGDTIIAVLSLYLKERNMLKGNSIVATVMSNLGLKKFAESNHIEFKETKVGDRYVLEEMLKSGYNLGGEQSGHIIFLDYNPTGDGILTSLMYIRAMLAKNTAASELNKVIEIYPQVLINSKVNADKKNDFDKDEEIVARIKEAEEKLNGNGRVLIRASGTEPKVRVMIEGKDLEQIEKEAEAIAKLIENKLG